LPRAGWIRRWRCMRRVVRRWYVGQEAAYFCAGRRSWSARESFLA